MKLRERPILPIVRAFASALRSMNPFSKSNTSKPQVRGAKKESLRTRFLLRSLAEMMKQHEQMQKKAERR